MAAPIRPAANVCSGLKNSKPNLAHWYPLEKHLALSGPAMGFAHSIASANADHANRHAEGAHRCCVEGLAWCVQTFDREHCPIHGLEVAI